MKYLRLLANPKPIPEKVVGYGPDVSDWMLDPEFELECQVCKSIHDYKAPAGYWAMWQWNITGALESIRSYAHEDKWRCPSCGVFSSMDDESINRLFDEIDIGTKELPRRGAGWALQAFQRFMKFHKWGCSNFQYKNEPGGDRQYLANTWLPEVCGCKERCQPAIQYSKERNRPTYAIFR